MRLGLRPKNPAGEAPRPKTPRSLPSPRAPLPFVPPEGLIASKVGTKHAGAPKLKFMLLI